MISWHPVDLHKGFSGFGDIDPCIDWAFGGSYANRYLRRSASAAEMEMRSPSRVFFPILLRLRNDYTSSQFANGEIFAASKPEEWMEVVRVPPVYLDHGNGRGDDPYFTALVRPTFFDYFNPERTDVSIEEARGVAKALRCAIANMGVGRALLEGTFKAEREEGKLEAEASPPAPSGMPQAGTVVVGIIDRGLAFANARFRTAEGGTRVEHIWLQDGVPNPAAARYGYGLSLSKANIDEKLCPSSGLVDEDEVYAQLCTTPDGVSRSLALPGSHGTHVMDVACGYEPGCAPRTEDMRGVDHRPIVCVQLPIAASDDTSGASLDTFVADGVRYILDKADEIAGSRECGRLPVVINFSYGTIAGPHDGTSNIERAIGNLIRARRGTSAPLEVVVPAGNSRLKRCHALVKFEGRRGEEGSTKCLSWRVLPDDRTPSHLEIWLPPKPQGREQSRLTLVVQPPSGEPCEPMVEHTRPFLVWGETPEEGMCYVRYCSVPGPTIRGMFLVTLTPTTVDPDTLDVPAPAGEWKIILKNCGLEREDEVHAWIQRDDTRYGQLPFGRQSYFDDPEYVRFGEDGKVPKHDSDASLVKRAGTLNAIATEPTMIVVGGFCRKGLLPAEYSGEGPAISRKGPDVAAVSDESVIRRGVLATGTRSGSIVALTGTSVAAPQIARLVACLMAQGTPADRCAIRRLAREEDTAATPEDEPRIGTGRIHRPPIVSLPGLVEED